MYNREPFLLWKQLGSSFLPLFEAILVTLFGGSVDVSAVDYCDTRCVANHFGIPVSPRFQGDVYVYSSCTC